MTWQEIVHAAMDRLGDRVPLGSLYDAIERHPRAKTMPRRRVRAIVRQVVDVSDRYGWLDVMETFVGR